MRKTLQEIFRAHFEQYAQGRTLHAREWRAANAIMSCHSAALGGHVLSCEQGHYSRVQYNACRHRSCPRCAERPRQQWLLQQLPRLLACEHFHVVFTLAHEFMALWEHNRAWMNRLLFDCARMSLLELCADERHLGAKPGILMSLHSWGRTLSKHPHVHCLVSAGGMAPDGQWRASRAGYLVPVKALSALYRGKLLHALRQALREHKLTLPAQHDAAYWERCIKAQYRCHWNVQIGEPYAHGRGVALYLARYVKGGPLGKERALYVSDNRVSFSYTDHRDHRAKSLALAPEHFIARVLWHAPPRGQHLVRHCGLYATGARGHHRHCMRQLLPPPMPRLQPTLAAHLAASAPSCKVCEGPLRRTLSLLPTHRAGEYSIGKHRAAQRLGPTSAHPHPQCGPTPSSSGQTPAGHSLALRRRSLRRRLPLN